MLRQKTPATCPQSPSKGGMTNMTRLTTTTTTRRPRRVSARPPRATTTTRTTMGLLVPFIVLSFLATAVSSGGVQSSVGSATYAGGMTMDAERGILYLTGSMFSADDAEGASACFAGVVKAGEDGDLQWVTAPQMLSDGSVDSAKVHAACSALTKSAVSSDSVFAAGSTEHGGMFSQFRATGQERRTQYGIVVQIDFNSNTAVASTPGGYLLHDQPVQYPVAIVTDEKQSNYAYVASLFSLSTVENDGAVSNKYPNLTSGGIRRYGRNYGMILERLRVKDIDAVVNSDAIVVPTLEASWRKPFAAPLGVGGVDTSIFVSGLLHVADSLIVIGSTRGHGPAIGSENGAADNDDDDDMDVFITKMDPSSGDIQASKRIDDDQQKDQHALGVCHGGSSKGSSFFIVGTIAGANMDDVIDIAYIAKISVDTLDTEWTVQIGAKENKASSLGLACAVHDDFVYLAGIVENGATVDGATGSSSGGDDVFVARLSATSGERGWTQQIGTSGNDRLAHGGGIVIEPKSGRPIVYGDTTGALYRERDSTSTSANVFLVSLDSDTGAFDAPVENGGSAGPEDGDGNVGGDGNGDGGTGDGDGGTPDNGGDGTNNDESENEIDVDGPGTDKLDPSIEAPEPDTNDSNDSPRHARRATVLFVGAGIVMLGVAAFLFLAQRQQDKEIATDRSQVFAYLQNFDVEDVDLRHSATGGWHGTYVNKLAQGYNRNELGKGSGHGSISSRRSASPDQMESAPLTHSSIVKDSLFLDVDSKPSLGGNGDAASTVSSADSSGGGSTSRGYDGLVGAYNDTYGSKPKSSKQRRSSSSQWGNEII